MMKMKDLSFEEMCRTLLNAKGLTIAVSSYGVATVKLDIKGTKHLLINGEPTVTLRDVELKWDIIEPRKSL